MKNIFIGISMLVLAFYLLFQQTQQQQELIEKNRFENPGDGTSGIKDSNESFLLPEESSVSRKTNLDGNNTEQELVNNITFKESLTESLSNQHSSLVFTNSSGSIREVKLKEFSRLSRDYNMSHLREPMLALSFEDESGRKLMGTAAPKNYELVKNENGSIVYRWKKANELRIERYYSREDNDTYVFDHKTVLTNLGNTPLLLDRLKLNLGSAFRMERLYNPFDNAATYLNVGYYNDGLPLAEGCSCAECSGRIDGEKEEFFQLNEMGVSGELETRKLSQAKWACVNNQFFVNIVRPTTDLSNTWVSGRAIQDPSNKEEEGQGVTGSISFPLGILRPNQSKEFSFQVYAGPKDYSGLAALGYEQKKVMQFGVFWWISEPFSWILNKLFSLLGSYGLAIVILTILVKLILWPPSDLGIVSQNLVLKE